MEILIHKFYKTKNNNIVVIIRYPGFCATRLIAKPRKHKLIEAVAIAIVQDFLERNDFDIKFVDDPDCEEDVASIYYETCYGWEA